MEAEQVNTPSVNIKKTLKKEQRRLLMKRFLSNKLMVIGTAIMILLLFITFVAPLLTPYSPYQLDVAQKLNGPSAAHWLGTDEYGRDLLTRIIYGARVSMGIGLMVSFITAIIGTIIGLLTAYYRAIDGVLMRIMDGLMAFPSILLAIALMAALGPKVSNIVIALTIVFTPYIARVVRSTALSIKEETYIESMQAQGASDFRIIFGHIAPNILSPMIVQATFIFADSIINEASLSFLGAGVPSPKPSWGNILYDGKLVIFNAPGMVVFSGIVIILSVLSLNLLGDGLRDLLDPHIQAAKKKK